MSRFIFNMFNLKVKKYIYAVQSQKAVLLIVFKLAVTAFWLFKSENIYLCRAKSKGSTAYCFQARSYCLLTLQISIHLDICTTQSYLLCLVICTNVSA